MIKHRALCAIICCVCVLMFGCTTQNHQVLTLGSADVADEEVVSATYLSYASAFEAEYQIDNSTLFGRGKNSLGLFGENTSDIYEEWVQITDITNIVHVEAVGATIMFLTESGCVYILGLPEGLFSEGENNSVISSPMLVSEDCVYASLGIRFLLLLKSDHTLWFLGESKHGQSTKIEDIVSVPTQIAKDILFIKAFGYTAAWIDSTYSLYMCGDNSYGQIGNGRQGTGFPTLYEDIVSTPYLALKNCIRISTPSETSVLDTSILAETVDGTIYAWGGEYGNVPQRIN